MSQISIQNLSFTYPGSYDPIFSHVTLTLDDQWKLGLIGRNGRGKTTLLHLLAGVLSGTGSIRAHVDFCCFPCTFRIPNAPHTMCSPNSAAANYGFSCANCRCSA